MTECAYCNFKGTKIFEDEHVVAALPDKPMVPGHVLVYPKRHMQIFEQATPGVISQVFDLANKISIALFEGLGAQGTNLVVMSGIAAGQKVPHFAVDVLPRAKDDGVNLAWNTRKLSDDQMAIVEGQVKSIIFDLSLQVPHEDTGVDKSGHVKNPSHTLSDEEPGSKEADKEMSRADRQIRSRKSKEDLFIKQLRRLP